MIKRPIIVVLVVTVAVLVTAVSIFYLVSDIVQPVERPSSVPVEAVWTGGAEGGSWIRCSLAEAKGTYRCSIYSETGTLLDEGLFALSRESFVSLEDLISSLNAYDGKHILLSGGKKLVPVDTRKSAKP